MSSPFSPDENQVPDPLPIYAPGYLNSPTAYSNTPKSQEPPYDGPTGNIGLTFMAWLVIISLTSLIFGLTTYTQYFEVAEESVASGPELMQINFQSKIMVGMTELMDELGQPDQALDQDISSLNSGPPEQRFCYAILVSEMRSPEEAYETIWELKDEMDAAEGFTETDKQEQIHELLSSLFDNYSINNWDANELLTKEEQNLLSDELGWAGKLALHPRKGPDNEARSKLVASAKNTLIKVGILGVSVILAGLAGVIAIIILFAMAASGSLRSRFFPANGRGGIYAETFAVWMIFFFGSSIGLGIAQEALQLSSAAAIFCQLAVFFGSLVALAYPVIRGIPFATVREDIGWKLQNPLKEVIMGGVSYLATMPIIAVGMVAMFGLMIVTTQFTPEGSHQFVSTGGGGHPIQDEIASGNMLMIIGVFLTACVAAPVVEETMFRGVLYRHLRENKAMARALVVIFSALLSSFIFAIIHPQGIVGIPVLMSLAVGFAITREWRSSLIAPMTMHAIHNSLVTCVMLLML